MKASLTSSVLFFIFFTVLIVALCSSEERIEGKYKVTVAMNYQPDTTDESVMDAIAFLSKAQIQYEFMEDGTVNVTTISGETKNSQVQQWTIHGDSIFLGSQHYKFESASDDYMLSNNKFTLLLDKQ